LPFVLWCHASWPRFAISTSASAMDEETPLCQDCNTPLEQKEDLAPSTPQELPPSTPEAWSVQRPNVKEGAEQSPAMQRHHPLPAVQALPTPCRGRRRTPTHHTPVNEDLVPNTPEVSQVQAESIQNTTSKEGEEPSSAKQQSHSFSVTLPTPCRGGHHCTPPLHYMAVNEAETIQNISTREGEELSPAMLQLYTLSSVRFDSFEASDLSTTGHLPRHPWAMPGKLRFYATLAAALAPVVVLLVAVMIFFDPGHHVFHDDLTARPVSANLQGLIMPGAQQTEGGRSSATFGPLPIKKTTKANKEKAFDFRPRFYDQGSRENNLVEAPTNLAGGLPGPFTSGHDSWVRQRRPLTAPENDLAVVAAAEAAGAAALHTESSQGTSSTARRGAPAAATIKEWHKVDWPFTASLPTDP